MTDEDDSHFYDDSMPIEVSLHDDPDYSHKPIEITLPSIILISSEQALRLAAALIRIANNVSKMETANDQ